MFVLFLTSWLSHLSNKHMDKGKVKLHSPCKFSILEWGGILPHGQLYYDLVFHTVCTYNYVYIIICYALI